MKKFIPLLFLSSVVLCFKVNSQVQFVQFTLSKLTSANTQIADLDKDGNKDIIMVNRTRDTNIVWFQNLGNGYFSSEKLIWHAGGIPTLSSEAFALADFNNDGHLDFAADNYFGQNVLAFVNDRTQNFNRTVVDFVGEEFFGINTLDINNDRYPEIVAVSRIFNNSGGIFDSTGVLLSLRGYSTISHDFDGDSYEDLAQITNNNSIVYYQNNQIGGFKTPQTIDSKLEFGYFYMSLSDLNSDGNMDILYPSSTYFPNSDNIMKWYQSDGKGNFTVHNLMVVDTNYVVTSLFAEDINGDGQKDLVASMYERNNRRGKISCFWNQGGNVFDTSKYQLITTALHYPVFVRVDDIDGDGDQDILSASYGGGGGMAWFQNQSIPNTTSVNELQPLQFTIYPNPFTSHTTISFEEEQYNTTITLMDLLGKELKSARFYGKEYIFDRDAIASGMYLLQIRDEKRNMVNKKIAIE